MQFESKPIVEHREVPLADEGRLEHLVEGWAERHADRDLSSPPRSYVVSISDGYDEHQRQAQCAEILALVQAQGDELVGHELRRSRPDAKTFLGRGAAVEVAARARELGATMLVLDAELSPSQARNLEDVAGIAVCDREAVILNVFLRHAKTAKARIQVEIAQLEYLRPRIRGLGLDMDQQAGGLMKARGPGETASELLARRLDGRLLELRKQQARLERAGEVQRKAREGSARIVLVGYTNAGKTSLMNALTGAGLSAKDVPFETLDTTSRCLSRHGGDVILSDTVGFIRRLPERLRASFESTLSEITEATLLVIVVDASDPEQDMHIDAAEAQIARLGAGETPRLYVFNKLDRLVSDAGADSDLGPRMAALSRGWPHMAVSSHDGPSVELLREALLEAACDRRRRVQLLVPYAASELLGRIYANCRVLDSLAVERGLVLTIEGRDHVVAGLRQAAKLAREDHGSKGGC